MSGSNDIREDRANPWGINGEKSKQKTSSSHKRNKLNGAELMLSAGKKWGQGERGACFSSYTYPKFQPAYWNMLLIYTTSEKHLTDFIYIYIIYSNK